MNNVNNTEDNNIVPPITITVSTENDDGDTKEKNQQIPHQNGRVLPNEPISEDDLDDAEYERYRNSKSSSSRKASFFIGDDEQIPVTIVGPDNKEITPDDIVIPPDGGYGYVIVFAAFMTNFIIDGTIFSFGILLDEIVSNGDGIKVDSAAWIGSLLTGFYLMSGPLVSSLCNQIGFRLTAMAGSVIGTLGFVLAWYFSRDGVPNMPAMFLCYGILGGIGFGLAYVPSIICVGFYFSKKRALATGIAICGSGIGTFCYAPLIAYLIAEFQWQGSLLIQAGLIFTCVAFAALYRPLQPANQDDIEKEVPRTPNQTPVGTPLLLRIKRARELQKWDSVNSFSSMDGGFSDGNRKLAYPLIGNGTTTPMEDAKNKSELYEAAKNKSSSNSLSSGGLKGKKLSVPTIVEGQGVVVAVGSPQRTSSIKNRSFVGLPVNLKEIAEETEIALDENGVDKNLPTKATENEALHNLPSRRSIFLRRNSTMGAGVGSTSNMGSRKGSNTGAGGGMTLVLSSSALQPLEMSQSRILRVATSKSTLNKPLLRDDIFYSGSLSRIPEYSKNVDAVFSSVEWKTSMAKIPSSALISLPAIEPEKKFRFLVLRRMLDFSLLKSPTFLILAISGAITMMGFFVPFIYCKAIAEPIIGPVEATFLISIIGVSNTAARIFCGALADRPWVNPLMINNAALTLGGLATLLVPFLGTHSLFIVYCCVFGISVACFASLRSILIVELLGLSKLTNAFGLLLLFQGFAALLGSPLAGFLKEVTGAYEMTFYVAGAMMLISGVMCYPLHFVNNWEKRKAESKELLKDPI